MHSLRLRIFTAIRAYFGEPHTFARAEGWRELRKDGLIIEDLVHLGHLFEDPLTNPKSVTVYTHDELVARAARKALVLQLLARAEITHDELNHIRQNGGSGNETVFVYDDGADDGAGDQLGNE
mgnify:CR=1 FL=1